MRKGKSKHNLYCDQKHYSFDVLLEKVEIPNSAASLRYSQDPYLFLQSIS